MKKIIKIAITGPESTGKTTLSKDLAKHFDTTWAPEYAREYLANLQRNYEYEDLEIIALGQINAEQNLSKKANKFLFCDTDLLVIKIWSEWKYGKVSPVILDLFHKNNYDLHILCGIEVPWEQDPLRENPYERTRLYELYLKNLKAYKFPFIEISGNQKTRVDRIKYILTDKYFL